MSPKVVEKVPLCVDLDGTLIRTDLLWESIALLLKQSPMALFLLPLWLVRGRAYLKRQLARRVKLNPTLLPYRGETIEWLKSERAAGRRLVLTTASDEHTAKSIAAHLGIFDEVIASDGARNLKGAAKLEVIEQRFATGFDYAGDSIADNVIWNHARKAIAVEAPHDVVQELARTGKLERTFASESNRWTVWRRALRLHQWSKNFLILVPVITSHRVLDATALFRSLQMFLGFGFCASALYLVNDLLDLASDRAHPEKCSRPLARGDVSIFAAFIAIPLLLAAGFGITASLGRFCEAVLFCYCCVSFCYSLWLKTRAPLDVFLLSGLYTVRILAGGVATHIWLTGWLLSFSVFLFMSLAFTKRLAELRLLRTMSRQESNGRGYLTADFELVTALAVSAGFISSLVLAFYVNSDQVRVLYREPLYLWLLFPVLLYWLTKLWLLAFRGELREDPVLYAIKSPSTYAAGFVSFLLLVVAKFDLPARLLR
ncbi:MAG TPA: UbiA family prenyltransferase [Bryobacteraceae bacterium]|nr:UbiA family prenyltransferase [Bryobacteraceae bacterium]